MRLIEEAEELDAEGRHEEAIARYQEIIDSGWTHYVSQEPGYEIAKIYHGWAAELQAQGQYDQAVARYRELIGRDSDLGARDIGGQDAMGGIFGAYVSWAEALDAQGDHCGASEKYRLATDCVTRPFEWNNKTYFTGEELEGADACYYRCGSDLQAAGRFDAALGQFSTIPASSDNYQAAQAAMPECYYSWAMQLKSQERHGEAIEKYVEILESYPKWPSPAKGDAVLSEMRGGTLLRSLEEMLDAQRWEGAAWLYQGLMDAYPTSAEADLGQKALREAVEAFVSKVAAGTHGTLPTFSVEPKSSHGLASIEIRNACPYALTVLLLGPRAEVVSISPDPHARAYRSTETTLADWEPSVWESRTVMLEPGEYSVVAMVGGSSIAPHYGTSVFEADSGYTSYYYLVTTAL